MALSYRTDKQFMKNPATASQRIYIGNIAKATISSDLEERFKKHGVILGLVINSGFAFIQFETDDQAHKAISVENGSTLNGRNIIVRPAVAPTQKKEETKETPQNAPAQTAPPVEEPMVFEQPETIVIEEDYGPNIRPPQDEERGGKKKRRGGGGGGGGKNRNRSKDRYDSGPRGGYNNGSGGFDRGGYGQDYREAGYGPEPPLEVVPPPERNDCEIIVVSRALTEYAEFIEGKLKQMGLIVDLLFPNEDVPIGRVLANISSRGCLYAMLVMPQNEEHRSLTLNILHGIPQEHRNMPIEDAMILISRNFEAYMRGETLKPDDPNLMSLTERHPVPIQMLLNLLAENRMLTSAQYDRIIKYLQEKRDLQHQHEIAEGLTTESNESSSKQQADLTSRILNILNKSNEPEIPKSITAPKPDADATPTPILKDPTVQRALDSLLTGDMFKAIAGGH